jgi:hypothetical protein
MIDWYVEISDYAPKRFKCDEFLKVVIETATPFMNYFCNRLSEIEDWKIEDAEKVFGEIIEEMPIMNYRIYGGEFIIIYNKYVSIRLTDTIRQIYREIKLGKILA